MGRYMRKNKVTMEVSQSSLGVRTRARTLAMAQQERRRQQEQQQQQQQQQKQSKQVNVLNFCYLELRSRKLEKFFEANSSKRHKPSRPPKQRQVAVRRATDAIGVVTISRSSSFSSSKQQSGLVLPTVEEQFEKNAAIPSSEAAGLAESCLELRTGEIEVSCGDNAFDHDGHSSRDSFDHARRLRESTPVCNEHDMLPVEAPGSSSRVRSAQQNQSPSSKHLDIPSPEEIEDFFAAREEPDEEKSRVSDRSVLHKSSFLFFIDTTTISSTTCHCPVDSNGHPRFYRTRRTTPKQEKRRTSQRREVSAASSKQQEAKPHRIRFGENLVQVFQVCGKLNLHPCGVPCGFCVFCWALDSSC